MADDNIQDLSGIPANDMMAQLELQRRLKMAQALQENKVPEGQMIGGHYVAPSWTQQLASAYGKYQGGRAEENAMKQYGAYAKSKENKLSQLFQDYIKSDQPTEISSTQDNFVTKPLTQGMNVPTAPSYSPTSQPTEQVAQAYPNYTGQAPIQNMQGNMSVNEPITSTTLVPKTKQEKIANLMTYINKSGNTDLQNKVIGGQAESLFKTPESVLGKVDLDKFDPQSINNFIASGSKDYSVLKPIVKDIVPTTRQMKQGMNEITQQWDPQSHTWIEIAKGPAFKPNEGGNAPAGYRPKSGSATGELEFIPGGPADPNKTVPLGNRESVFINRIGIASNETAKDLENIVKIPLTTSRGVFGGRQQGGSLFDAGKESLTNAMTTQDVQSYNVLASGLQRNLAAIEAAGLAPSGTLTHQMDAVIFKNGDTNFSKLQKLAQIKQIANAGIETTLSNPRLPEKQVKHFEDILDKINKAVPFDNGDLITLQQSHQTNPNISINDIVKLKQKNAPQSDVRSAADAILGGK